MHRTDEMKPLKRAPAYGVFRWWPEAGEEWVFPDDLKLVRSLIPGERVFRREDGPENWLTMKYGDIQFRVRSAIWLEIPWEGFDVGDVVEVKSRMGSADPFIGRIRDMFWNQTAQRIDYYLDKVDSAQVRAYSSDDLTPLDPLKHGKEPDEERRRLQPSTFYYRPPPVSGSDGE